MGTDWIAGQDLPPVGTVCRISEACAYAEHRGKEVRILAHTKVEDSWVIVAVFVYRQGGLPVYHGLVASCFEKIVTKEELEKQKIAKCLNEYFIFNDQFRHDHELVDKLYQLKIKQEEK